VSSEELEYLRLPKGFHVRDENYMDIYLDALLHLTDISKSCGYESVFLPSLGFQSTFARAAEVLGEKAFEFTDRKGRGVLLSPDSTAGLLRWHAGSRTANDCSKIAWCAPVFRYRNVENRGFHQIGFSAINWFHQPYEFDWPLIDLSNNLLDLIRRVSGEQGSIKINNVGAIKRTITSRLPLLAGKELISKLMKEKSSAGKIDLLTVTLPPSNEKLALLHIFGAEVTPGVIASELVNKMQKDMRKFAARLKHVGNIDFALDNLHSSEIVDGIGIEFYAASGERIGDGGRYDTFAGQFDSRCRTLVSVCTGIEALVRHRRRRETSGVPIDLAVVCFPEAQGWLKECVYQLRASGLRVEEIPIIGKPKAAVAKAKQRARYYCVTGTGEMQSSQFMVNQSSDDASESVPLELAYSKLIRILLRKK